MRGEREVEKGGERRGKEGYEVHLVRRREEGREQEGRGDERREGKSFEYFLSFYA